MATALIVLTTLVPRRDAHAAAVARFADVPGEPARQAPGKGAPSAESAPPAPVAVPSGGAPARSAPAPSAPAPSAPAPSAPAPSATAKSSSRYLSERAARFAAAGRLTEAMGAYAEAIRLSPDDGASLVALGQIRAQLGELSEAELLFTTAARLRTGAAAALSERAHLRRRQGRDGEAVADLEAAIALGADDTALPEELSAWYVARRAWLPALAVWRRVAAETGDSTTARRASIQTRALGLIAGNLDSVRAGADPAYSWTRRALARLMRGTRP